MKFYLVSPSVDIAQQISYVFRQNNREIEIVRDEDALILKIGELPCSVVLIDVKLNNIPGFNLSRELKEKSPSRFIKTYLIITHAEPEVIQKMMELWKVDGVIMLDNLEQGITSLLSEFSLIVKGNLKEASFIRVLMDIRSKCLNGTLTISREGEEKGIYFKDGIPIFAITSRCSERIGEYLKEYGKLSREDIESSLAEANKSKKRLGRILIKKGLLTEDELIYFLKKQMEEIVLSVFLWDDADYTFGPDNIAEGEDVLMESPVEDLIYNGMGKYFPAETIDSSVGSVGIAPAMQVAFDKICGQFPFTEEEKYLIQRFDGTESIVSLFEQTEIPLKDIQRIVFILRESGSLSVVDVPFEKEAVMRDIEGTSRALLDTDIVFEPVSPVMAAAEQGVIEAIPPKPKKGILRPQLITAILAGIAAFAVIGGLTYGIMVHKRANARLSEELFLQALDILKTDTIPGLTKASKLFSRSMDLGWRDSLAKTYYALAQFRLFENTNDSNFLKEAKNVIVDLLHSGKMAPESRAVALLVYSAENENEKVRELLDKGVDETGLQKFARAKFLLDHNGNPGDAASLLIDAVKEDDGMVPYKLELIKACLLSGCIESKNAILGEIERTVPGHPDLLTIKGELESLEGRLVEAENLFRYALELRPGYPNTLLKLGALHMKMHKNNEAMAELGKASELTLITTTVGAQSRFYYARALMRANRFDKAMPLLKDLIGMFPYDMAIKSKYDELTRTMKKQVEQKDEVNLSPTAIIKKSREYLDAGRFEDAERVLKHGLAKPNDEILYYYGISLDKLGKQKEAFLQFKKAEGLNPENPLVHKELGRLYKELFGNEEASAEHLKNYLQYLKK